VRANFVARAESEAEGERIDSVSADGTVMVVEVY